AGVVARQLSRWCPPPGRRQPRFPLANSWRRVARVAAYQSEILPHTHAASACNVLEPYVDERHAARGPIISCVGNEQASKAGASHSCENTLSSPGYRRFHGADGRRLHTRTPICCHSTSHSPA